MKKPTIIINGKVIEMKSKARLWTSIAKFDNDQQKIPAVELVDEYCKIIAVAFGVTKDEILDNLDIEEVVPKYIEVYNAVAELLTANLDDKKNEIAHET